MAELEVIDEKTGEKKSIFYETFGDPKNTPLIMIHGWLCNDRKRR